MGEGRRGRGRAVPVGPIRPHAAQPLEEDHMVRVLSRRLATTRAAVGLVIVSLAIVACGGTTTSAAPSGAATTAPSGGSAAPSAAASAAATTIESIKMAGAGPVLTLDGTKAGDLVSVDAIFLTQGDLYRQDAERRPPARTGRYAHDVSRRYDEHDQAQGRSQVLRRDTGYRGRHQGNVRSPVPDGGANKTSSSASGCRRGGRFDCRRST